MGAPAGSARIVLSGTLPGGEIWSTGFWMTGVVADSPGTTTALAEVIGAELSANDDSGAMTVTAATLWSNLTFWDKVTAYSYPNGGTVATYIGEYTLPSAIEGALQPRLPNQVAAVLSLRTGLNGRSHRGRMYLPCTGVTLNADAQLSTTTLATETNAWALAFTDINASSTGKIVVVSQKLAAATQVSSVIMDSRCDIQRSRAKQQSIDSSSVGAVTL